MAEARRQSAERGPLPKQRSRAHAGTVRAVIDGAGPMVDAGRFPSKAVVGRPVQLEADCFTDGHDRLRVLVRWQVAGKGEFYEIPMTAQVNDVWVAEFTPPIPGRYQVEVIAWVDHFESWRDELSRRTEIEDIRSALLVGEELLREIAARAPAQEAELLGDWSAQLRMAVAEERTRSDAAALKAIALDQARADTAARHADRSLAESLTLEIVVDRERAAFSSWYEMFPRSAAAEAHRHGTFRDVEALLPYIAEMEFDVLYFPPIHPIGRIARKGRNNSLTASPEDVGSPWAIGAAEGGHKHISPLLGTIEDFRRLIEKAAAAGLEIALDLAFQCAPDHPYVAEHPEWFKHRPDGSVQYAENPPKKYQDIYPFDFESPEWRALWAELKSIVDHWIEQGVLIFRVDNPHTKSFRFWEWLISEVKREHPEVIFLAEAFTRPKVMHRLAKLGFSQSYTYFTWRVTKQELTDYFEELAHGPGRLYFRPNVWPNTPDILHETLQWGGRAAFAARLVLAATLSANYGVYGPSFELLENTAREPGSEEYLDSEKYQLRHWDLDRPDSLRPLIARINRIRRDNPPLQSNDTLRFCTIDNPQMIAYLKRDQTSGNAILTVVNLDPHRTQSGWVDLDLGGLALEAEQAYQMHDLLSGQRFLWRGPRNFVMLDPQRASAHVFKVLRGLHSEKDFDYFR